MRENIAKNSCQKFFHATKGFAYEFISTVTPWTDMDHNKVVYFPIRLGYASTIHKVQGDEFAHITIWLDVRGMPAAGYTALSRVSRGQDYLIGGVMTRRHFVPATHK